MVLARWVSARGVSLAVVAAVLLTLSMPSPVAAQGPEPTTTTTLPVPTTTTSTSVPTSTTTTSTTVPDGPDVPVELPTDPAELAQLIAGYDEAVAFEAELLLEYEISVGKLEELNGLLVELSETITQVEIELIEAESALTEAENRRHLAEVRLEEVESELATAQQELVEQAVTAYIYGDVDLGLAGALLAAEAVEDLDKSRQYASAVAEHTTVVVEEYAELQVEAELLRGEAEDAESEAEVARDEVDERKTALEDEREVQARAQADAFVASLAQQDLIDQVQLRRDDYEGRLRNLRTTSDSISNILRESQAGQSLPDEMDGIFLPPVEAPLVTSGFGPRLHPIFGTVRMHNGLDIDANLGTPLRAAASGVVVLAEWRDGYGLTTVIDHGNGLATLYGHQSSVVAEQGDDVEMGDIIGLAGSTGWSTGPHVHWEVRIFGNPTDPITFLGPEELLVLEALNNE